MSAAQINLSIRTELLRQLPHIIQQAVKPIEKIDSIRLFHVSGLPQGGGNGSLGGDGATMPEQVANSALRYQIAKQLVDAVMRDAGLANGNLTGISEALAGMVRAPGKSDEKTEALGGDRPPAIRSADGRSGD